MDDGIIIQNEKKNEFIKFTKNYFNNKILDYLTNNIYDYID